MAAKKKCIRNRRTGKMMCRKVATLAEKIRDTRRFCRKEGISKKKCDALVARHRR